MDAPDPKFLNKSSGFVDLQPSMFEEPLTGPGDYSIPGFVPEGPKYSFPKAERFMTPNTRPSVFFASLTPEKFQVNIKNIRSSSAPTSSFKYVELKEFLQVPGPGAYESKSTLFDRNITMKGKYKGVADNGVPGPAAYNIQIHSNLKFPLMKDERMKNPKVETANVALVNCELGNGSPSYSFGGRIKEKEPFSVPGPGAYEQKSTLYSKDFTIRGKPNRPEGSLTPGPGYYAISPTKSAPSFSISLPWPQSSPNAVPGPGAYNINSSLAGPKYSMRQRFLSSPEYDNRDFPNLASTLSNRATLLRGKPKYPSANKTPGPGSYSLSPARGFSGYSYGRCERIPPIERTPGPGEYNPVQETSAPCYSMLGRGEKVKFEVTPGPGAYEVPVEQSRSTLLRGKPKESPQNPVPSPWHYSPERSFKAISYSQSRANRFEEIEKTPGPGDFHSEPINSGPKYSFTSRPEEYHPSNSSPGPGAYDIKSTKSNISFSLRGKYQDLPDRKIPGPGSYTTKEPTGHNGYTQGKSSRTDFTKQTKTNPGPGQYNHPESHSVEYSFGKAERNEFSPLPERSPGPGSYDPVSQHNSRSAALRGKPQDPVHSRTPGPGSYNLKDLSHSPSFKFGQKFSTDFDNKVPGPGNYSHSLHSFSPSWTMAGRSECSKRLPETSPGPGAYNPSMSQPSLSFSIFGKRKENIEKSPGPGDYESVQYKSQGFTFGQKPENKIEDTPGPGAYDPRAKSTTPSWSMNGRTKLKRNQDKSPGPGQYNIPSTNSKKACTISKVGRNFSANNTPGPGHYDSKTQPSGSRGFSQGRGKRVDFSKIKTETPGPAAYDVLGDSNNFKGKFATADRIPKFCPDSNGPLYKIELKPDGPHYSIKGKWADGNQNSTPGPGSYEASLKNKKSTPAYTMGCKRDIFSKLNRVTRKNFTPVRSRNK